MPLFELKLTFNSSRLCIVGISVNKSDELVFVFLGKNFPNYASYALKLAKEYSGLNIRIITDEKHYKKLKKINIQFNSLESFYVPDSFNEISHKISMPSKFRDGFWLRTLERFFVLEQFMTKFNCTRIFHAELDQLLFNCSKLLSNLDNSGFKGIALPFHSPEKAIASVFYCNDVNDLRSLVTSIENFENFENEMSYIAKWAYSNPEKIKILPTLGFLSNEFTDIEKPILNFFSKKELEGVCDAAQLGQWVGGEDPRNVPISQKPKNKFNDTDSNFNLKTVDLIKLKLDLQVNGDLIAEFDNQQKVKVYNLHLHSKVHKWLCESDGNLDRLLELSNDFKPHSLPSTRKTQILYFINIGIISFLQHPHTVISSRFMKYKNKANRLLNKL